MKEKLCIEAVAMNWFRREDYERLLLICEDAPKLPQTFNDWLKRAELGERRLEANGTRVIRVLTDPDELATWCAAKKLRVNGHGRMQFAIAKAKDTMLGRNN